MSKVILWGASGQGKAVYPILGYHSHTVIGVIDQDITIKNFLGYPVYPSFENFLENNSYDSAKEGLYFVLAIGGSRGQERVSIQQELLAKGLKPLNAIHPTAWVAPTVQLGRGVQILAMAALSEEIQIDDQTIVNTNATVDHETRIGQGVHIMPGATIAGCCTIHDFSSVGSNATILPRLQVGVGAIVGAGAVVTKDVPDFSVVMGVPARVIKQVKPI